MMTRFDPKNLPEPPISPPSEAWNYRESARQSKIRDLQDYLAEIIAALNHITETQHIINYVDPNRNFIRSLDMNHLWAIRGRLAELRQHLRDELDLLGDSDEK